MYSLIFLSYPPYELCYIYIAYKGCPIDELFVTYDGKEHISISLKKYKNEKPNTVKISVPKALFENFCASTKDSDPNEDQLSSLFSGLTTSEGLNNKHIEKLLIIKSDVTVEDDLVSAKMSFSVKMKKGLDCIGKKVLPSSEYLTERIKINEPVEIFCTACDLKLTTEMFSFEKVVRCCEGMASELSENWFCHADVAAPEIKPEPSQLLCFDSSSFYFHSHIAEKLSVQKVLHETALACTGCGSVLTPSCKHRKKRFSGFFCDKVDFRHPEDPVDKNHAWKMAWAILRGMVDDVSPVCKLYLHSKGKSEEQCLLLCIRSPQVIFFEAHFDELLASVPLLTQDAYPVSFLSCKPESKLVRAWRHDFEVDFYYVSDTMLRIVEEGLLGICEIIPNDIPLHIEGFRESFLIMS